jgi:hypothetical protein
VTIAARRPAEVLSELEALALLRACSTRAPTGIRNRALIAVLWRCGLRISKALALEPRDVDLQAGTLRVRHGKGDKSRTLGLDEQTAALLARWLDRRQALAAGRSPVFCTLNGDPIDSSYIRRLLPRLAHKAGIDRRVHAHGLRHTHAAELAREGTRSTSSASSATPPSPSPTATSATSPHPSHRHPEGPPMGPCSPRTRDRQVSALKLLVSGMRNTSSISMFGMMENGPPPTAVFSACATDDIRTADGRYQAAYLCDAPRLQHCPARGKAARPHPALLVAHNPRPFPA